MFPERTTAHGEATLEHVYSEALQPTERTRTGAGVTCKGEGAAERAVKNCPKQLISHFPSALHHLGWGGGKGVRNEGIKLSMGKGKRKGKVVLKFLLFVSHYQNLF